MIKFKQTKTGIQINIPTSVIKQATEEHPMTPARVIDKVKLTKEVMFELEHKLGEGDEEVTGFQKLIDEAIESVVEMASDSVVTEDDDFDDDED